MSLQTLWFVVLAVLWVGFLLLEGFDFGVGMLHGFVGQSRDEKGVAINAIGPVWDGNEVWLIVAGAGTFAAFPDWYATMFSGFYLAMVLVLVALIIRGVSFEFRRQRPGDRWVRTWDGTLTVGSFFIPLLIGVALGNLLHGVPIDAQHEFTGTFVDLLNPYSLFVGITIVLLCLAHGAAFLALKTDGVVRERSARYGRWLTILAALAVAGFAAWTIQIADQSGGRVVVPIAGLVAIVVAIWLVWIGREGWAFIATSIAMLATVATLFVELYPRVMVSSTSAANDLTISNASSSSYTLKAMTVVALIFLPLILLYQGWTYHVFRQRVGLPPEDGGGEAGGRSGGGAAPETGPSGTAGAPVGS
ncbi:MAG TPA: cytochrome d ubiquinol oxidase subunit II [Thermoleophilia bacterium]|nr:cytochrome d ubiquinol oxidase subunit II [Thermoleophilia bacterium]